MSGHVIRRLAQQSERDANFWFMCPGCGYGHGFRTTANGWSFNGDMVSPTISPSILATGQMRCHSFVENGEIRFLSDCDHSLAGKTVPLPVIDEGGQ